MVAEKNPGFIVRLIPSLAIYVPVLPVTVPACIAVMYVAYTSLRAQALTLVFG